MQNDIKFISHYNINEQYTTSFNELAYYLFDTDLTTWLEKGFDVNTVIPFSYVYQDKVIANATANLLHITIDGSTYKTVQISTVMTHPDFRNNGLSKALLHKIIQTYEQEIDFFYLYANETVLNFYPKVGFKRGADYSLTLSAKSLIKNKPHFQLKRLNMENTSDYSLIERIINQRHTALNCMDINNGASILLFQLLIEMDDIIYYIQEEDMIVIFEIDGHILHLYDVISIKSYDLQEIISRLIPLSVKEIHCYFESKADHMKIQKRMIYPNDDVLFTKAALTSVPKELYFPLTSRA